MKAPEKIYITSNIDRKWQSEAIDNESIEYTRTDAFIEKTKKWFEQQPETYDGNGVRVYGEEDFEDFVNYIKESKL